MLILLLIGIIGVALIFINEHNQTKKWIKMVSEIDKIERSD